MSEVRHATPAEQRRLGVKWRIISEWRKQLPASSYTYVRPYTGQVVTRSQAEAEAERQYGLGAAARLRRYAEALGVSLGEAAVRVARQRDIMSVPSRVPEGENGC